MISKEKIMALVEEELRDANEKHPQFASHHEAYAVILEEVEETRVELDGVEDFLQIIWRNIKNDNNDGFGMYLDVMETCAMAAIQEAIQVVAMCEKARRLEK